MTSSNLHPRRAFTLYIFHTIKRFKETPFSSLFGLRDISLYTTATFTCAII